MSDCIPLTLLKLLVFQDVQDMVLVDGRMVWVQVAHILRYKILKGIKDIILLGAS